MKRVTQGACLKQLERWEKKDHHKEKVVRKAARYKVAFEFVNDMGRWQQDDISFQGTLTRQEAEYWCNDFKKRENIRNVGIVGY